MLAINIGTLVLIITAKIKSGVRHVLHVVVYGRNFMRYFHFTLKPFSLLGVVEIMIRIPMNIRILKQQKCNSKLWATIYKGKSTSCTFYLVLRCSAYHLASVISSTDAASNLKCLYSVPL